MYSGSPLQFGKIFILNYLIQDQGPNYIYLFFHYRTKCFLERYLYSYHQTHTFCFYVASLLSPSELLKIVTQIFLNYWRILCLYCSCFVWMFSNYFKPKMFHSILHVVSLFACLSGLFKGINTLGESFHFCITEVVTSKD